MFFFHLTIFVVLTIVDQQKLSYRHRPGALTQGDAGPPGRKADPKTVPAALLFRHWQEACAAFFSPLRVWISDQLEPSFARAQGVCPKTGLKKFFF